MAAPARPSASTRSATTASESASSQEAVAWESDRLMHGSCARSGRERLSIRRKNEMALTPRQLEQFHRDGYILVPDLFDLRQIQAALAEMERIFYGKSFAEYLADFDQ